MDQEHQNRVINTKYFKSKEEKEAYGDRLLSGMLFFAEIEESEVTKALTDGLQFANKNLKANNIDSRQLELRL